MKKLLVLLGASLLLCNCASISTLQTARTLEKGDSEHSFGLSMYSSDDFLGGDDISLPVLEYTYRRGLMDKLDFGVKLAIIGSTVADIKYNLINGEKFALATGLGIGYLSFTSTVGTVEEKSTILDFIVPLYLSYDVGEITSLYGAAKYFYRSISTDSSVAGDGSMASGTFGVKVGKTSGVYLEGSLITGLDNDFSGTQFNTSYFFKF
ncbi:MAG: hypothetical protein KDD33_06015 [Bdellovibrionales bacterium]|nr:hypothetical protein [Bdellovibrionales bacterium]